ncbi:MAG TPA: ribosome small subunit-dependent GTPase A [Bacteroidetes bacterium]|nr:ribosome small subunit-dependent GTPase A [Bacteroidota bacterium]
MKGLVLKSTGSWYLILGDDGKEYRGRARGKLRLDDVRTTNPIAVGDGVLFEMEAQSQEDDLVNIHEILPRRNYIIRKSNNLSKQTQIIAANMDLVALVVTMATPATSTGFIDRFLLTAEAYHIPALIVFNKIDIYGEVESALLQEYERIYEKIGYECIQVSAIRGTNMNELRDKLRHKTTLFSGHSGVGKSTLMNALDPHIAQKTAAISTYSNKGKHTTTFAEMFLTENECRLIDTPGIKDFGVVNLDKHELAHYFPEMRSRMQGCRFNDCLHTEEPNCAILAAVESGEIEPSRYYSYLSVLNNEDIHH